MGIVNVVRTQELRIISYYIKNGTLIFLWIVSVLAFDCYSSVHCFSITFIKCQPFALSGITRKPVFSSPEPKAHW